MNRIAKAFSTVLLTLALIPGAYADTYKVIIKMITQKTDSGDVVLLFKPGEKENGFSGKAKGVLLGTDLGTNKSLAVILTAVSMDKAVSLGMDAMPSTYVTQTITSVGMAP